MALTRAQLLMGNNADGTILSGQPQGVRPGGPGIFIAADGVISVDASTIQGVMRLNNGSAYNSYSWPASGGTVGQQLTVASVGGVTTLVWADSDGIPWTQKGQLIVGTGVGTDTILNASTNRFVLKCNSTTGSGLEWTTAVGLEAAYTQSATPGSPIDGQLWYDCTTGYFKVYQSCVAPAGWTSVAEPGLPIDPATQVTAAPPFSSGAGTSANPYIATVTTVGPGTSAFVVNTVTITSLAPFQYVPIYDLNVLANGGRFTFSNNYADGTGTLVFQVIYIDLPVSAPATTYTAQIKVGYNSAYIDAIVNIVSPFTITSPGSISGQPSPGSNLVYTQGTYSGGVAPVTETWTWRRASDNAILQSGGLNYLIIPSLVGDRVYVRYTVTDSISRVLFDNTTNYPASPATIQRSTFPNTTFSPSTGPNASPASVNSGGLFGTATAANWSDGSSSLTSTGSLQFNINGGGYGQGPSLVNNGDSVGLIWDPAAVAVANHGTVLQGCLTDGVFENCYSMTVDRSPNSFAFNNLTNQQLITAIASNTINPAGFNVPVSFWQTTAGTTLTNPQVAIAGGGLVNIPTTLGAGLTVNPGDQVQVQGTTGNTVSTDYFLNMNLGSSTGTPATSTWTVQTTATPPSVSQPSVATPVNNATGIATTVNVTGTAYSSAGGAGPHASTDWRIVKGDLVVTPTSAITKVVGPQDWSAGWSSPTGLGCNGWSSAGPFTPGFPTPYSQACTNSCGTVSLRWGPTTGIVLVPSDVVEASGSGCPATLTLLGVSATGGVPQSLTGMSGVWDNATNPLIQSGPCCSFNYTGTISGPVKINGVPLFQNICNIYLTDATALAGMSVGDTLKQTGGGAEGTIYAIDTTNNAIQVTMTSGAFTVGSTVFDSNTGTYPPAPTSWPPGAGYTVVANVTGDTVNLTSYPLAGLSAQSRYYAQLQYNSATIPTASGYSAWSGFTTA